MYDQQVNAHSKGKPKSRTLEEKIKLGKALTLEEKIKLVRCVFSVS